MVKILKRAIFILIGIVSAIFGIQGFLLPNHFVDGGITGTSMLIAKVSGLQLALLIPVINAPFLLMAFYQVNRRFAVLSIFTILAFAVGLGLSSFPMMTNDKLLAAIFGGFFLGAGIGLAIRAGSVLDGTEILALVLSKKIGVTVGDLILVLNIFIFGVGIFVLGLESALYSVLTYVSASKTVDFILHGIEEYNGITIISSKSDEVKSAIFEQTQRGVTVYKGKGGFSDEEKEILFCVVTRLEIPKIKSIVEEIDPGAFLVTSSLNEASGGMVKARPQNVYSAKE
jgi:uncharacterized membrane-anchored protein YitT (DUF2179 family)